MDAHPAAEGRLGPAPHARLEVQPRHLVLVLVGHELVEVADRRAGDRRLRAGAQGRALAAEDVEHRVQVARRRGDVLVADEAGQAHREQPAGFGVQLPAALEELQVGAPVPSEGGGLALGDGRLGGRRRAKPVLEPARIVAPEPAVAEGRQVLLHRGAVQGDGALDGPRRERQEAGLPGHAERQDVGGQVVAEERLGEAPRLHLDGPLRMAGPGDGPHHVVQARVEVHVADHLPAGEERGVHHRGGAVRPAASQVGPVGRRHGVEGQVEIGAAQAHLVDARGAGPLGEHQGRQDRAPLLRGAGLIVGEDLLAVEQRRPGEQRADGEDAGPSHAGDDHLEGAVDGGKGRLRDLRRVDRGRRRPPPPAALHLDGDEGRTVAAQAEQVLVAARLVHLGLRAKLGVHLVQRHAVGERAAVAAVLADLLVDEHEAGGGLGQAPLLPAAPLVGALAVVEEDGRPRGRLQVAQDLRDRVASVDRGNRRQVGAPVVGRVAGHDGDLLHPLQRQQARQRGHVARPDGRLPAGVGHRAVVEDAEGDVHAGGHREADVEVAGVEEAPVSLVLDEVDAVGEGGQAHPAEPLAAELEGGVGVALGLVDERGEDVAARGAPGHLARQHQRGEVVRAAAAVVGRAPQDRGRLALLQPADLVEPPPHPGGGAVHQGEEPGAEPLGHLVGVHAAEVREERGALQVPLAQHLRPVRERVERLLEVLLQESALLLDHHHLLQAAQRAGGEGPVERVQEPHLHQADPGGPQRGLVQPEVLERLQRVGPALPGADHGQAVALAGQDHPVEAVGPGIGHRRRQPLGVEEALGLDRLAGEEAVVLPLLERALAGLRPRQLDGRARRVDGDDLAAVAELTDELHGHPQARVAGHRHRVQAQFQKFGHRGGVQHRHPGVDEVVLLGVRHGGALGLVVLAGEHHHRAVAARAGVVAVPNRVAGPVEAGALAVPEPDHAVVARVRVALEHLCAHERGGGHLLVLGRAVHDAPPFVQGPGLGQRQVVAAEGRAGVAGDEGPGPEAGGPVAPGLVEGEAHQGLHAGEEDAARLELVAVVQGRGARPGVTRLRRWAQGWASFRSH